MITTRKTLAALLLVSFLISPATAAAADREADLYQRGTKAIDARDWSRAVDEFSRVIELKGSRADGALYWTAYALHKLGRRGEADQALATLRRAYPKSRWLDDAEALELEMREARGERVAPEGIDDDDLKMIAINSLMHTDPEKAYPLLEKIIRGNTASRKVKERAVFVLTQSSSARAHALLADIARGKVNPELQREAVKYLGVNGSDRNLQVLSEIYASSAPVEIRKSVLKSFMIAGDKSRVLTAAKSESDPELRKEAIQLLGVMNARSELAALYAAQTDRDSRERILQSLFIAGDGQRLGELARTERDPHLRQRAIRNLGLVGNSTAPLLLEIYASEQNREAKEAVIQAFFVQGNSRALIDLSKREKDPALRKEILQKLSIMGDDEAVQHMLEILND